MIDKRVMILIARTRKVVVKVQMIGKELLFRFGILRKQQPEGGAIRTGDGDFQLTAEFSGKVCHTPAVFRMVPLEQDLPECAAAKQNTCAPADWPVVKFYGCQGRAPL